MSSEPDHAEIPRRHITRTKIVATVGPASSSPQMLAQLAAAGVDVFRLNLAHGDLEEHTRVINAIRQISQETHEPLAVLADLAGPKLRLGAIPNDEVELATDAVVHFVRGTETSEPGTLVSRYPKLLDELNVADRVLLADGTITLVVTEKTLDRVACRVVQGGTVRSRQGINLPGTQLSLPTLTDRDREHAAWAARVGVDFVSLSFVRTPNDVVHLRQILVNAGSTARLVAKIEKPEAIAQIGGIIAAADAIMVARGDLGVELDPARVPMLQKEIIALCNAQEKPVIVATQMLESMHHSLRPTRAEASDVANAILDGTDACMLSGETAVGDYPLAAVQMMARIATETEKARPRRVLTNSLNTPHSFNKTVSRGLHPFTHAIVQGTGTIASQLEANLIVVASHTGATVAALSRLRLSVPIVAVSDSPVVLRQMALLWGVTPIANAPLNDPRQLLDYACHWGSAHHVLRSGDRVVYVAGSGLEPASHNQILLHQIP
jgi:pyruvate kinase